MTTATGTTVTLTGIAAAMAFIPSGIPGVDIAIGAGGFFAGCCCLTGMTLYTKLGGTEDIALQYFIRQIAMLLCCVPLALVASSVVFLAALLTPADVNKDAPAIWGFLLILGVRGPKSFQWLMDTFSGVFTRFIPGQKPATGSGGGP